MQVLVASIALLLGTANAIPYLCHCQPSQSCWPTASQWATLNASINGNLVAVVPVASPCHVPNYNAAACAVVMANSHDSVYRAAQPGALQWENWEAWPEQNQYCYVESPESVPCGQGRVSLYSAEVVTAADIQATINFAVKYNIKLAIKNTGHDFLGRSSAPNSLQLNTYKMKNIAVNNAFVPAVDPNTTPPSPVRAVTVGAGVELHAMYEYLNTQNVIVVGGSANTVGIAGGYLQGGGHSLMGHIAGMGSDNALEFQVVTAAGALITANAYQNTDMFYALRGGGGGTYGVVVSATVKAYPNYPVIFTQTNYTLSSANAAFWNGVEAFHEFLVPLNDAGGTGYYYITPFNPVGPGGSEVATFVLYMWFVNATNTTTTLGPLFPPLLAALANATGEAPSFEAVPFPSMTSMFTTIFTGSDTDGFLVQLGSRLVSRNFVNSPGAPAKIAAGLQAIGSGLGPADYIEGNVVAGGQVAANAGISSGLNPAWRSTVVHLLFTRRWDATTPPAQVKAITQNITNVQVPILKSFEPGQMGAYLNEADANEPNFQQSFWGNNYYRLYGIKSAYDPNGVFISRKGVGSEYWDDDGACHNTTPSTRR